MTRTIGLVVVLAGAIGLGVGWLASVPRRESAVDDTHSPEIAQPVTDRSESGRHEFRLRRQDIADDRETPAVAADANGRVLIAWAAVSGETERTIHLARSDDGGKTFNPPSLFRKVPIYRYSSRGKDKAMTYSTHALPRLTVIGDRFQLGWVEAIDGGPEVHFYVAASTDGGKTFSAPESVHGTAASRPGFTALTAAADGSLLASWLEGRDGPPHPFFAERHADSSGFDRDQRVFAGPDKKGICPCCDLAAARLPDGSNLVAFRNTDGGHRDIWFARAASGGPFKPARPLSLDNWTYSGCPHDGPSLVIQDNQVVAAWMSGRSGRNRIYAATAAAAAADLAFTPHELSPGTTGSQGHPKLAATASGRLYAVWDESVGTDPAPDTHTGHGKEHSRHHALTGDGRDVMLASMSTSLAGPSPGAAVSPRAGAFQLNPAIAIGRDGALLIAWNEIDTTGKRVVFVRREPPREPGS